MVGKEVGMPFVSEKTQYERLQTYGVTIRTKFWENHNIRIRTTDHSRDDDVRNGIILQKKYFLNGKPVRTERDFSPLLMYTYLGADVLKEQITCPNCGYAAPGIEFSDGCPCCGTAYNIEYADRQDGGQFFADRYVKDTGYYVLAFLACLAVCLPVSFFLVRTTGRTFMFFDKLKALFFGGIPALFLFYLFYVTHAFVITGRAEEKYERQTQCIREFKEKLNLLDFSMNVFYNNLHSELNHMYYDQPDVRQWAEENHVSLEYGRGGAKIQDVTHPVIDMDLLECRDFEIREGKSGVPEIGLTVHMRKITLKGRHLKSGKETMRIRLRESRVVPDQLHPGINIIQCRNCGAAIDVTQKSCAYCGTKINYGQRLYISEIHRQ